MLLLDLDVATDGTASVKDLKVVLPENYIVFYCYFEISFIYGVKCV